MIEATFHEFRGQPAAQHVMVKLGELPLAIHSPFAWPLYRGMVPRPVLLSQPLAMFERFKALQFGPHTLSITAPK
ncbi:MAG: hypothetical protein KDB07_07570, partial [Planctomycetes bacterium]|nr:hypothetical protein [Planctomycetota bacterium]